MKSLLALAALFVAGPVFAGTLPIVETARSPVPVTQALGASGEATACPVLDALREQHAQR